MELKDTLKEINKGRDKVEASFVFSVWKDPSLYEDYNDVELLNKDAKFYWELGKGMYKQGIQIFDAISIASFLGDKPEANNRYNILGGYSTVNELMELVHSKNADAYFDKIAKMNILSSFAQKYDELFSDVKRFENSSAEDVYDTFELLNNEVSLRMTNNEKVESLGVDDSYIQSLEDGDEVGYNYSKYCPILNYITLGAAQSSMYMIGAHSGVGKSSFTFGSIILGLHYNGVKTAIISNEMKSDSYKALLLEHILTRELGYYGLTRKQLKIGRFNDEQRQMVMKAAEISRNDYSDIFFVKMFDNNTKKICKYMKRLKSHGVSVILLDTFKADDDANDNGIWQSLLMDSRKIFQTASKLGICVLTTYQLALRTTDKRFLDATCLSNAKQIKEIYETMIYMRPLWDDERPGGRFDVHPYRFDNGEKITVDLDPNEKYYLIFVDKTRADEDKIVLIYRWRARFNEWKELGYASVINEHNSY